MSRVATATISISALKHNLSIVRQTAPQSKILAVIKAHAYGHGMLTVASALQSADAFAVAHMEEAEVLRLHHADKPIVLLQGFTSETELAILTALQVQPVIHSFYQIDILEKSVIPEKFWVWLKVDTGMNRLGFSVDNFKAAWSRLNAIPGLKGKIRLMSHFANADDVANTHTQEQIDMFNVITEDLDAEKSMANSAGLLAWKESHYQWVRPGIMLYGVSPFLEKNTGHSELEPVMTLQSSIIAINEIKKSQAVGYGSRWQADEDTCIAIVACGYGDGYPRHISKETRVLINGNYFPIVGTVSMDMICINIGRTHQLKIGDKVTMWGKGLPIEDIAQSAGTIAYELLCQVTSRVHFEKSDDGKN